MAISAGSIRLVELYGKDYHTLGRYGLVLVYSPRSFFERWAELQRQGDQQAEEAFLEDSFLALSASGSLPGVPASFGARPSPSWKGGSGECKEAGSARKRAGREAGRVAGQEAPDASPPTCGPVARIGAPVASLGASVATEVEESCLLGTLPWLEEIVGFVNKTMSVLLAPRASHDKDV